MKISQTNIKPLEAFERTQKRGDFEEVMPPYAVVF